MKRIQLAFLFLLICKFSCFSQSVLKGVVTDSLQKPLAYANVIAQPLDSLKKMQFSISNNRGFYSLKLERTPYIITTSFIGYKRHSFKITPEAGTIRDIILLEQANVLDEVIIELPVTVKQDTIVYNTDKFITGDERKLIDILKKLPGVEVEKDGTVRVQGKKITTLLVENKIFFGGGTKLAIDNIPANAIDEIEVIENYSEIAFLKNLVDGQETAMNIKLKENKKDFVFGDIEAGMGNRDFYRTHTGLFYYSPKTNVNVIGNSNNIAEQVFTYKQYFDFQGSSSQIFEVGSATSSMANDDLLQFIESNDVIGSNQKFGAVNVTQDVNNKFNISGYGIFSNTEERTYIQSTNQYNTFTERKDVSTKTKNVFLIGNVKMTYLPNLKDQWVFNTQFKKTDNHSNNTIHSLAALESGSFFNSKNVKGTFFNQSIEWHKQQSKKHTFSSGVKYIFNERTPRTDWATTNAAFQTFIPVAPASIYNIFQEKYIRNNYLYVVFKHYWVLNRYNHIYTTIGNSFLHQTFFTNDSQELEDGTVNEFSSSGFGNDLSFSLNDLFLGFHYKFKSGIFTFNQGVFFHDYYWKARQHPSITKSEVVVLPDFSTEVAFSQSRNLTFNYRLKTSFSDASKFANRYYLQSYNTVYKGNAMLENELFHELNLRYRQFSLYNGFRLYANASYIKKLKSVENAVNYEGVNQYLSSVLLDNAKTSWRAFGKVQKKFKRINYGLGLNYSHSNYLQQLDTNLITNKNTNYSYQLTAKTLFDDFPGIEIGFKQIFGKYRLGSNTSKYLIGEPFINVDYDFLKGFIGSFDYMAYFYRNQSLNQQNNYNISNVSLYYRNENSAWSFKIESQNLFNVKFKSQNSFSTYIISNTETNILHRTVVFSIGYNL